jgi:hypothetical protein
MRSITLRTILLIIGSAYPISWFACEEYFINSFNIPPMETRTYASLVLTLKVTLTRNDPRITNLRNNTLSAGQIAFYQDHHQMGKSEKQALSAIFMLDGVVLSQCLERV